MTTITTLALANTSLQNVITVSTSKRGLVCIDDDYGRVSLNVLNFLGKIEGNYAPTVDEVFKTEEEAVNAVTSYLRAKNLPYQIH